MFKHASYDRTEIENVDGARHLNASEQASTQHGPAAVPTRIVEGNGTQRAIRMSTAVLAERLRSCSKASLPQ